MEQAHHPPAASRFLPRLRGAVGKINSPMATESTRRRRSRRRHSGTAGAPGTASQGRPTWAVSRAQPATGRARAKVSPRPFITIDARPRELPDGQTLYVEERFPSAAGLLDAAGCDAPAKTAGRQLHDFFSARCTSLLSS